MPRPFARLYAALSAAPALVPVVIALLLPAAPAMTQTAPLPPPAAEFKLPGTFRLGPGDILNVTVWKQPALSMQLPVLPDGTLRYPLAGHLDVQGRTVAEVEATLELQLREQLREAVVSVTLVQVHSYRVYVIGEVLRPGEYVLRTPVSIAQALAIASGFTPFAKRDKVLVVRGQAGRETRRNFDYNAYVQGEVGQNITLEPGDTVIVQ